MEPYVYPYEDFVRDYEQILPSPNASTWDLKGAISAVRAYCHRYYPTHIDRVVRGAALLNAAIFIGENLQALEDAKLAVTGEKEALVKNRVFRAIHALVVESEINGIADEEATVAEVIALARTLDD